MCGIHWVWNMRYSLGMRYEVGTAYEVAINGHAVLLAFLSFFSLFLSLSLPYHSMASQSLWALLLSPSSQATAPQSFFSLSLSLSILFSRILVNRLAVLPDPLCLSLSLSFSLSVPYTSQRGLCSMSLNYVTSPILLYVSQLCHLPYTALCLSTMSPPLYCFMSLNYVTSPIPVNFSLIPVNGLAVFLGHPVRWFDSCLWCARRK